MICVLRMILHNTPSADTYPLSLHDALPICLALTAPDVRVADETGRGIENLPLPDGVRGQDEGLRERSEEHTSELQSLTNLVCRLLLEKNRQHSHCSLVQPYVVRQPCIITPT